MSKLRATERTGEVIVIGAGGHAKVVIEVARAIGWMPVAVFDPAPPTPNVLGVPVRGSDDAAERWVRERQGAGSKSVTAADRVNVTIAIGLNHLRRRISERMRALGAITPTLVHPTATISPTATLGEGTVVMAGAVVNADARIGRDVIVNTLAVVEHDCILGDGCHVGPRTVMGGNCRIGAGALFGLGACARPKSVVGKDAVVGAGSVVTNAVPEEAIAYGVPARMR